MSSRLPYVVRADRWFELHRIDGEPQDWAAEWRDAVKKFVGDVPLYMIYPETGIATNVVQYPTDRIAARFGTYFMTSSFAWMMALAIDELRPFGSEPIEGEISVFGVDMEYGTEYVQQRAGFKHYIDLARMLDIPITRLASGGMSYEPVPYPMWQDDPLLNKLELKIADSSRKLKELNRAIRHTREMIAGADARVSELNLVVAGDYDPKVRFAELQKEHKGLVDMSASLSKDIVHWQAVSEEQGWLKDFLQP
ncbi:MAG TPA: hypothetical protein ENH62_12660 [Marinobacter sp.]|nr:hypothetical protein [Marinobacter sp.]